MIRGCMRTLASALLTAAAAIAVYPASRTAACTSPPMEYQRGYIQASSYVDRKPNIAERTETADIVVLGTVTEVLGPEFTLQTAMIEVDSYLKGDAGPRQVEIRGFGRPSLCKSSIPAAGTSVIVFASGDPYSPMSAHYSPWRNSSGDITTYRGHNNAVAQASAENIQKVSAAADQPQARPSVTPVTPPPYSNSRGNSHPDYYSNIRAYTYANSDYNIHTDSPTHSHSERRANPHADPHAFSYPHSHPGRRMHCREWWSK